MSLLIKDGLLVTQDESRRVVHGDVYVEDGIIVEVGSVAESAETVVDATGCVVIPGLINGYTRAAHLLLGPPKDQPLELSHGDMTSLMESLTRRDVQMVSALACSEMLQSGTTCFLDVFPWQEEIARAVTQVGIRAFLAWLVSSVEDEEAAAQFVDRVESWERVTPLLATMVLEKTDVIETTASLAVAKKSRWCLPLAETRSSVYAFQRETGERPLGWLESKALLSPDLLVLHAVWMTLNEIRTLAREGVGVIHCPVSNQLTGAGGPAPLVEMLREGVRVGLGTDSPAVCGNLNLFEHMRACAALHRGHRWDPMTVNTQAILDLVTVGAAGALGLDGGCLTPGRVADLVILDPQRSISRPLDPRDVISYLVYLAGRHEVRDVVVDGRVVVEKGTLRTLDVEPLRQEVTDLRKELLQ